MCGLPDAWISPSERSMAFGTSSLTTYCEASRYPGDPGCMRSLPDCVSNSGSQPISSSAPEQIIRSALRARARRLGRASIRCGSCSAVVAEYTDTLSPASSSASAPHSGSHARTLCIAAAGSEAVVSDNAVRKLNIVFILSVSDLFKSESSQRTMRSADAAEHRKVLKQPVAEGSELAGHQSDAHHHHDRAGDKHQRPACPAHQSPSSRHFVQEYRRDQKWQAESCGVGAEQANACRRRLAHRRGGENDAQDRTDARRPAESERKPEKERGEGIAGRNAHMKVHVAAQERNTLDADQHDQAE